MKSVLKFLEESLSASAKVFGWSLGVGGPNTRTQTAYVQYGDIVPSFNPGWGESSPLLSVVEVQPKAITKVVLTGVKTLKMWWLRSVLGRCCSHLYYYRVIYGIGGVVLGVGAGVIGAWIWHFYYAHGHADRMIELSERSTVHPWEYLSADENEVLSVLVRPVETDEELKELYAICDSPNTIRPLTAAIALRALLVLPIGIYDHNPLNYELIHKVVRDSVTQLQLNNTQSVFTASRLCSLYLYSVRPDALQLSVLEYNADKVALREGLGVSSFGVGRRPFWGLDGRFQPPVIGREPVAVGPKVH